MSESRATIIAANWKMYKTQADVGPYFDRFFEAMATPDGGTAVVFYPSHTLIQAVAERVGSREGVTVGAQDCHWEPDGAFTGEVSTAMITAAGATEVLAGHSERRHLCGESDDVVGAKLRAAFSAGLVPTLCVGETLEEREAGRARSVVLRQLTRATDGLGRDEFSWLRVAYEPVWAIGTGRTASPNDAQEMHAAIREILAAVGGRQAAAVPVLYGGSVKPENARELLAERDIDGALVGGASLDPVSFAAIVSTASRQGAG